jgi:hypothetical protein
MGSEPNQGPGRLLKGFFFLYAANFVVFVIIAARIGGDAFNGMVRDGHYFLSNHGQLTEVSPRVFTYSLWHVRFLLATFALTFLTALWTKWRNKRNSGNSN